jgi:hypothetical protein
MGRKTYRRKRATRRSRQNYKKTARRHRKQRGGAVCPVSTQNVENANDTVTECCKKPWFKFWSKDPEFNVTNPVCLKSYNMVLNDKLANPTLQSKIRDFFTKNPNYNKIFRNFTSAGYN